MLFLCFFFVFCARRGVLQTSPQHLARARAVHLTSDTHCNLYFVKKKIIKNARKKLETPMAPAMPCKKSKKSKHGETRSKTNDFKSKFACILEANESTRMRVEESLPKYHEDHIAGKE